MRPHHGRSRRLPASGERRKACFPISAGEQREEAPEQRRRGRRATADMEVDRHHRRDATDHGVGCFEDATVERAIAGCDHPFRVGRRDPGAVQCLAHVHGHRPGHEQHVGVARRSDKTQPEPLEVVEGVIKRMDFEFAAVARAGIDLTDRKAAAEPAPGGVIDFRGERGECLVIGGRGGFGQRTGGEAAQNEIVNGAASYRSCPE